MVVIPKWDARFLRQAYNVSSWSKDPSTKTGAVIVNKNRRIRGQGYNGFAPRVEDSEARYNNREVKYSMIIHCEINAVIAACGNVDGCTLYTWPFMSCATCASQMISWGISKCVAPEITNDKAFRKKRSESWYHSCELAKQQFKEAGVELVLYTEEQLNRIGLTLKGT